MIPAQRAVLAALGIAAIAAAGLAGAHPGRAQESAAPPAQFDVVSVKPNDPKDPRTGAFPSPGRLVIHNYSLRIFNWTAQTDG